MQFVQSIAAGTIALFVLNVFTLVYLQTGVHICDTTGATDYKWEPHQLKTTMEEGFAFLRMDSNGYCNREEDATKKGIDILLMGSSQVEGAHVSKDKLLPSLLNDRYPAYHTYSIGMSGHTIYHCMNNIRCAFETWKPKQYIILVTDTIALSKNAMNQVISGTWPRIVSYDSGMLYHVQKTAPAVKMLYKKIMDWYQASISQSPKISSDMSGGFEEDNTYFVKLLEFLRLGTEITQNNDCQLVIVYQPLTKIDRNGKFCHLDVKALECFAKACHELKIPFIDMTPSFEELYIREKCLAHGFANTAIGVGHLNVAGYLKIANALGDFLAEE